MPGTANRNITAVFMIQNFQLPILAGNIDSEILLKSLGYFPDYLSALLRALLRFFWTNLSKQLYARIKTYKNERMSE